MKKLTFLGLAVKVLKETCKPMSAEEIWKYAIVKDYDKAIKTKGKTPWRSIAAQIYVDMKDSKNSPYVKIDSKPRKFFLKQLAKKNDLSQIIKEEEREVDTPSKTKYLEKDLHPFLTYYAYSYLGIHTKTIKHEKSKRKSYTQWLHPDLVGVYFPIGEWTRETLEFCMVSGNNLAKLYSFEMKKELTFSNIRESFFQTVSNSSWANEGYLVAPIVLQDEEFMLELKRLSTAFGIGIIKLDLEDPDSSEILFSAKFKSQLDWETINKLAKENVDFRDFIIRIKNDLSSKEVRKEKYDKFFSTEELITILKSKAQ